MQRERFHFTRRETFSLNSSVTERCRGRPGFPFTLPVSRSVLPSYSSGEEEKGSLSWLSPEMSGSLLTESEIVQLLHRKRPGTWDAGLAQHTEPRVEGDEKKPETAALLSPPCFFGAAKQGRGGGQGWSEAKLQSRERWCWLLASFLLRGTEAHKGFPAPLRPLEFDIPIFHFFFYVPHLTRGECTGSLSYFPGPCPLLVRAVLNSSVPEQCVCGEK